MSGLEERFWAKVDKTDGCWLWTASLYRNGYGHFGAAAGHGVLAHRQAWQLLRGPIPAGLVIDHICRNRACVNPGHLRLVTNKQNLENQGVRTDNTSGVRGVSWHKRAGKWRAQVQHNGRTVYVGLFREISDANAAVVAKRNELFTHNDTDRSAA